MVSTTTPILFARRPSGRAQPPPAREGVLRPAGLRGPADRLPSPSSSLGALPCLFS